MVMLLVLGRPLRACARCSCPPAWAGVRRPGRLIQRSQQPEPASKPDLLCLSAGIPASTGGYRQPALRRIDPVHQYPDLHQPIVWALGTANIGQLADVSPPGTHRCWQLQAPARKAWKEPT